MAEKSKGGRPTKYRPEYCAQLISHMGDQGLSYDTFAAVIGVNVDTLYEWEKRHAAFSEAKKVAFLRNKLWWERIGIAGMTGTSKDKIPNFNPTVWIFNMKNRHGWRDRIETEHKGQIDSNVNLNAQVVKVIEQIESASEGDNDDSV